MTKKDFDKFISQKEEEIKAYPKVDWEAKKNEWLSCLHTLYGLFEDALKEYVTKGVIVIRYDEIKIIEELIGSYNAKTMLINIAGETIRLKPIGTNLIGSKGRVDMLGNSNSIMIVLVDSRMKGVRDHIKVSIHDDGEVPKEEPQDKTPIQLGWKFVTAPPTRKYQPVNEETIYSVLMELSNG